MALCTSSKGWSCSQLVFAYLPNTATFVRYIVLFSIDMSHAILPPFALLVSPHLMMEIVHPAAKYVIRGKVVLAQSIAPWAQGNGRNNFLAIPSLCAPMILVLKYFGAMRVDAP